MSDQIKVYLYFLGFNAEDLKVFFDNDGIAAVSYSGIHEFLHNADTLRHCFEEGYVDRRDSVAFVLYAFTEDPLIAELFESTRNSRIFIKKVKKVSNDEFDRLCRFREARLSIERLTCGPNQYLDIVMNEFEILKISEMDEETIVSDWCADKGVFEFMPLENGYSFNDDILSDSLQFALASLQFKVLLGEEELGPTEYRVQINEWSVFYAYFSEMLC